VKDTYLAEEMIHLFSVRNGLNKIIELSVNQL